LFWISWVNSHSKAAPKGALGALLRVFGFEIREQLPLPYSVILPKQQAGNNTGLP
jgi:hypothetical protein